MSPSPNPYELLDAYGREWHHLPREGDATLRADAAPAAFSALWVLLSRHHRATSCEDPSGDRCIECPSEGRCAECGFPFPCQTVQDIVVVLESDRMTKAKASLASSSSLPCPRGEDRDRTPP
jgi:hypothetical protein